MRWMFANGDNAIVAGVTSTDGLRMVHREYGRKNIGGVTVLANIAGSNVSQVLASRINPVVAVDTISRDVQVVEIGWQPSDRRMAVIACVATCYMRRNLSRRNNTVVARATSADNLSVIDRADWYPDIGIVAVFTNVTGLNMCSILGGRIRAVMTVYTVVRDVYMAEVRRQPSDRRVTVIAVITAGEMRRVLSNRRDAIVTRITRSQNLHVVNSECRCPQV